MMSKWLIVILFLAVMFLDGIIIPGLFGLRESFLTILFIVAMLLYCKAEPQALIIGVALSAWAEFYWGLKLGALMLSFLASAGAFFLLNKFFNIRSRVFIAISGVIMFIVFWETSVLISKIF